MTDAPDIKGYFHCGTCMGGKLAVGWTNKGLQVFCEKCNKNVANLDFLGQKIKSVAPTLEIKNSIKTKSEIEKKYEELNERMKNAEPSDFFTVASTDGQRYVLEWVLGQHG